MFTNPRLPSDEIEKLLEIQHAYTPQILFLFSEQQKTRIVKKRLYHAAFSEQGRFWKIYISYLETRFAPPSFPLSRLLTSLKYVKKTCKFRITQSNWQKVVMIKEKFQKHSASWEFF